MPEEQTPEEMWQEIERLRDRVLDLEAQLLQMAQMSVDLLAQCRNNLELARGR